MWRRPARVAPSPPDWSRSCVHASRTPADSAPPQTTAHAYMRRFFLRRSIVEDDPRELLLAAVYLAAKVCLRTGEAASERQSEC